LRIFSCSKRNMTVSVPRMDWNGIGIRESDLRIMRISDWNLFVIDFVLVQL
jgi:hypothetical protein